MSLNLSEGNLYISIIYFGTVCVTFVMSGLQHLPPKSEKVSLSEKKAAPTLHVLPSEERESSDTSLVLSLSESC